jgi:pyruvate dehydrogenase E1 component alpha subunit
MSIHREPSEADVAPDSDSDSESEPVSDSPSRSREPTRVQYLDADGRLRPDAEFPTVADETLLAIYEDMRLARVFDERAVSLQRQGRISTYAPLRGHEAAQVGSAHALDDDDWCYPTYRDHAAKFVRGMDLGRMLQSMRGHGDGYRVADGVNVMPEYIPIATQVPQAVGSAWAASLQGRDDVTLCYLGDGATSEGDFHEGLNFAGVFDTPNVFFCTNNQWAISVPRERQTASETLAEKAHAYGFQGVQVDGTDPLAVYEVTRRAVDKARDPGPDERRPTLIEAVTYRMGAHSTADDPSAYRDGVPEEWRDRDPLDRYESFLRAYGLLDDERVDAVEARARERVDAAVDRAEAADDDPDAMFEHVYAEPTPDLERQRAELDRLREKYGDEAFVEGH